MSRHHWVSMHHAKKQGIVERETKLQNKQKENNYPFVSLSYRLGHILSSIPKDFR